MGLEPASVCLCVCLCVHIFKPEYHLDQRADRNKIFYLEHYCGGGKAAICFGPYWIRNLISMATDGSKMVLIAKTM